MKKLIALALASVLSLSLLASCGSSSSPSPSPSASPAPSVSPSPPFFPVPSVSHAPSISDTNSDEPDESELPLIASMASLVFSVLLYVIPSIVYRYAIRGSVLYDFRKARIILIAYAAALYLLPPIAFALFVSIHLSYYPVLSIPMYILLFSLNRRILMGPKKKRPADLPSKYVE